MSKERERHELGYFLDAPLPTMLSHDDVYGDYHFTEVDDSLMGGYDNTLSTLANYLNNALPTNAQNKRPSIDEATFVHAWLPHFYNGNAGNEYDPSVSLTWINSVAGGKFDGAYHSVDVIRDGKVIFRVPPLQARVNIIGGEDRNKSVSMLYKEMDDNLRRVPHAVKAQEQFFLDRIFDSKNENQSKHDLATKTNLKYLYILDEIFTYYGYDSILSPELMSVKELVMGKKDNGTKSGGELSPGTGHSIPAEQDNEDDSDLFG